jgi:hypothetical protein
MKKLAALTGIVALVGALGAWSSASARPADGARPATTPGTETITGKVTGSAAIATTLTIPLTFSGVVSTTGTFSPPTSSSAHATITFPTKAGNFVVAAYAPNSSAPPALVNSATCLYRSTIHATYTVTGAKSTGRFAGATGSGKAILTFQASVPRYTSGSHKGQCNTSSTAQPLASGALASFSGAGPLTVK